MFLQTLCSYSRQRTRVWRWDGLPPWRHGETIRNQNRTSRNDPELQVIKRVFKDLLKTCYLRNEWSEDLDQKPLRVHICEALSRLISSDELDLTWGRSLLQLQWWFQGAILKCSVIYVELMNIPKPTQMIRWTTSFWQKTDLIPNQDLFQRSSSKLLWKLQPWWY